MEGFKTIIEPFRIKCVEPIRLSARTEREEFLKQAHYNPFLLKSEQVIIDLLTDSGTGAMSSRQWAGIMEGDESYAGAVSWQRMEEAVKTFTGMPHILPTHQGRAAERILYGMLGGKGKVFFSNTHFDTTRANIEFSGAEAIDLPADETDNSIAGQRFKGNLDTEKLELLIEQKGPENVAAVILTVTNNSGGGQPVSMENARKTAEICKRFNLLFVLDCCRIAENSWFIKQYEPGYEGHSYSEIVMEMFSHADAAIMSAKKDAMVNMGGFLALRSEDLANQCVNNLIITEGFVTYGGLSGRDMEALAIGLTEVVQPDYLEYRIRSAAYVAEKLHENGIPVLLPAGGHAVYVDAAKLYPQIPIEEYPGQVLVCELYLAGGIRAVEIGSVMFGKYDENHRLIPARRELVRLAFPRRVYTQSHMDYLIEVFTKIPKEKKRGLQITWEQPFLRHFTSRFELLG